MYVLSQIKVTDELLRRTQQAETSRLARLAQLLSRQLPKLTINAADSQPLTENISRAAEAFDASLVGFVDLSPLDIGDGYIGVILEPSASPQLEQRVREPLNPTEQALLNGQYQTDRLFIYVRSSLIDQNQLTRFNQTLKLTTQASGRLTLPAGDESSQLRATRAPQGCYTVSGNIGYLPNKAPQLKLRVESLVLGGSTAGSNSDHQDFTWEQFEIHLRCHRTDKVPGRVWGSTTYQTTGTLKVSLAVDGAGYDFLHATFEGKREKK